MAKFTGNNRLIASQQAMTTSFKSLATVSAATATLRRAWINDVIFSTDAAPTDNACVCDISRITALGTASAAVLTLPDSADTAVGTVLQVNSTVEPTVTAVSSLLSYGFNARATYRWFPSSPGQELVIPAVNVNGLAFRLLSQGYTGTGMVSLGGYE